MIRIKHGIVALFAVVTMSAAAAPVATYAAANVGQDACAIDSTSSICKSKTDSADSVIRTVVSTLLFLLGAVSVVMIIIGGFMYVTSGGDASSVTKAKNTIFYAVIGLVVAALSYAIVNFVLVYFG
jgi:Type IV secretion system pilin